MEFKNDQDRLSAYVLIDDTEETEVICSSLKKLGVTGELHESLSTLWDKMISSPINLVVVDIRLMNSEGKIFTDHPMYKNGTTEVIVFHREDDYPLLRLIESKNFFDFISESVSYDIFLRHTVRKLKKILVSEKKALESIAEIEHLENRLKRTQSELLEASEIFQKKMQFNKFMEYFWQAKVEGKDFISCLVSSCEKTDLISKMIIFYMGEERSIIKTYKGKSDILDNIAPVPLRKYGATFNEGFVEKTCQYISRDRLGIKSNVLRVCDSHKQVKYLIGITSNIIERRNLVQLIRFFDNFLSSEYQSFIDSNFNGYFVDEFYFNSLKFNGVFLRIDITSLNKYLKKESSIFLMKDFSTNFFSGLKRLLPKDSKIMLSTAGVYLASHAKVDDEIKVREYLDKFDYWNYFEDCDQNFSRLIEPFVTVLTKEEVKNLTFNNRDSERQSPTMWSQ